MAVMRGLSGAIFQAELVRAHLQFGGAGRCLFNGQRLGVRHNGPISPDGDGFVSYIAEGPGELRGRRGLAGAGFCHQGDDSASGIRDPAGVEHRQFAGAFEDGGDGDFRGHGFGQALEVSEPRCRTPAPGSFESK